VYLLSHLTHNNVHINTRQTGRSPFHSSQQLFMRASKASPIPQQPAPINQSELLDPR
jgi:hypothetical protein